MTASQITAGPITEDSTVRHCSGVAMSLRENPAAGSTTTARSTYSRVRSSSSAGSDPARSPDGPMGQLCGVLGPSMASIVRRSRARVIARSSSF